MQNSDVVATDTHSIPIDFQKVFNQHWLTAPGQYYFCTVWHSLHKSTHTHIHSIRVRFFFLTWLTLKNSNENILPAIIQIGHCSKVCSAEKCVGNCSRLNWDSRLNWPTKFLLLVVLCAIIALMEKNCVVDVDVSKRRKYKHNTHTVCVWMERVNEWNTHASEHGITKFSQRSHIYSAPQKMATKIGNRVNKQWYFFILQI